MIFSLYHHLVQPVSQPDTALSRPHNNKIKKTKHCGGILTGFWTALGWNQKHQKRVLVAPVNKQTNRKTMKRKKTKTVMKAHTHTHTI